MWIPTWFNIRALPAEDKLEVREKFNELAVWLKENYTQDTEFWETNPYGWQRWLSTLDFMDSEDHTHELPAFREYFKVLDESRKTNFAKTFPELKHLI